MLQDNINTKYTELCAAYAHAGFMKDEWAARQDTLHAQIMALNKASEMASTLNQVVPNKAGVPEHVVEVLGEKEVSCDSE
ncbi:MAG: hypothetical protein ACRENF_05070 [Thermodesulfobacteriota bacterium]